MKFDSSHHTLASTTDIPTTQTEADSWNLRFRWVTRRKQRKNPLKKPISCLTWMMLLVAHGSWWYVHILFFFVYGIVINDPRNGGRWEIEVTILDNGQPGKAGKVKILLRFYFFLMHRFFDKRPWISFRKSGHRCYRAVSVSLDRFQAILERTTM